MADKKKDTSKSSGSGGGATSNTKNRTIQVKIGQQSAREMTPDQAAEYLKCIATAAAVNQGGNGSGLGADSATSTAAAAFSLSSTLDNKGGGSNRISFTIGSRTNDSAATATSVTDTSSPSSGSGFWTLSTEAKEHAANSINAAVSRASKRNNNNNNNSSSSSSIPCSEKEMKALMSMFVEIMGLQMNIEKLNATSTVEARRAPIFQPGFVPATDVTPPPGGWPTTPTATENATATSDLVADQNVMDKFDDEDNNSLPDLEDVPVDERAATTPATTAGTADKGRKASLGKDTITDRGTPRPSSTTIPSSPTVRPRFVSGIAVLEWDALERAAMEDALEQEERARKASYQQAMAAAAAATSTTAASSSSGSGSATAAGTSSSMNGLWQKGKRSSSQRLSIPLGSFDPMTNQRAEDEKKRQQQKAIAQWRQKILSTKNVTTMKEMFRKFPIDIHQDPIDPYFRDCLWELASSCVPKNRQSLHKGREFRRVVLECILESPAPQVLLTPQRSGRSVLHTCCFYGDVDFTKQILDNASAFDNLSSTCDESGFTPLHYAALSGSARTVQILMEKEGSNMKHRVTNDTHTWNPSSGKGLTVTGLLQSILNSACMDKNADIETHGMAIAEMQKDMMDSKANETRFRQWLGKVLSHVEDNTFASLTEEQLKGIDGILQETDVDDVSANKSERSDSGSTALVASKKRRKKKKKGKEAETSDESKKPVLEQSITAPDAKLPEADATKAKIVQDPLVGLLKGMGFEEGPVIEGIAACGGPDRATADVVIAWMLERNQPEASVGASRPDNSVDINQRPKPQGRRTSAAVEISANTRPPIPNPDREKQPDEKMQAERLAAKREERRQRNREWNKKQEAQQTTPTTVPTSTTAFPNQPLVAPQGTVDSLSGRTVEFSVDAATVVSSVGDFAKDDDLTVSTIGSRTTTTQTQPPPALSSSPQVSAQLNQAYGHVPLAQQSPPGFNGLSLTTMPPVNRPLSSGQHWNTQPPMAAPPGAFAPPGSSQNLYGGLPPGIPESHPVIDELGRSSFGGAAGLVGGTSSAMENRSTVIGGVQSTFGSHGGGLSAVHSGRFDPPAAAPMHSSRFQGSSALPPLGTNLNILHGGIPPGAPRNVRENGSLAGLAAPSGPRPLDMYGQPPIQTARSSFNGQGTRSHLGNSYNQYLANSQSYSTPERTRNPGFVTNHNRFLGPNSEEHVLGSSSTGLLGRPPPAVAPTTPSSQGFGLSSPPRPPGVGSSVLDSFSSPGGDLMGDSSLWPTTTASAATPTNSYSGSRGSQELVGSSILHHLIGDPSMIAQPPPPQAAAAQEEAANMFGVRDYPPRPGGPAASSSSLHNSNHNVPQHSIW